MANQRKRLTTNQRIRICFNREKELNPSFSKAKMSRILGVSKLTLNQWWLPVTSLNHVKAQEPATRLAEALFPDPLRASRYSATVILSEYAKVWRIHEDFKQLPKDYSARRADRNELKH